MHKISFMHRLICINLYCDKKPDENRKTREKRNYFHSCMAIFIDALSYSGRDGGPDDKELN